MFEWFKKIISKIAAEVHKSKIDDFESKVAELLSEHKVMNKTITDNENKIKILEERIFQSIISSSKMEATIKTVLLLKDKEIEQLKLKNNE